MGNPKTFEPKCKSKLEGALKGINFKQEKSFLAHLQASATCQPLWFIFGQDKVGYNKTKTKICTGLNEYMQLQWHNAKHPDFYIKNNDLGKFELVQISMILMAQSDPLAKHSLQNAKCLHWLGDASCIQYNVFLSSFDCH